MHTQFTRPFPFFPKACDTRKQYASILTFSIEQFLLLKSRIPKFTNTYLQAHIQNFVRTLRSASFPRSTVFYTSLVARRRSGSFFHMMHVADVYSCHIQHIAGCSKYAVLLSTIQLNMTACVLLPPRLLALTCSNFAHEP